MQLAVLAKICNGHFQNMSQKRYQVVNSGK